jgi:hypothetical protein
MKCNGAHLPKGYGGVLSTAVALHHRGGKVRSGQMTDVNPADRVRITAVLLGPAGEIQNVYYFRWDGVLPVGDLVVMTDLAEYLDDAYSTINAAISSDYTYTQVRGFNVTQNIPMPTVSWPSLTSGGGGGVSNAAGVAGLIILRTGIARTFGRKYIGGIITANMNDDGFWQSALVTALVSFGSLFIGDFVGTLAGPSYLPGIISKTGQFWAFIEAVVTNNPAYQRRRRKGRGV